MTHLIFFSTEPKDPPKNVVVSVIPEEVNRVKVTFKPPEEPNGNITAYFVYVYEKEKLVKNVSLNITKRDHNMMTAVIEGLKGGHSYSIQVDALAHMTLISSPFAFSRRNQSSSPHFACRFLQRTGPVAARPAPTSR